jgi:PIN domain
MKSNHVLIDYENIQPVVADALAQPIFKVWVFVGVQQAKVKFDLVDLLQRKGGDARVIKMRTSGRNALDFHMSYYLGKLSTQQPEAYFHLVAEDTGMDPLVEHLKEAGLSVSRWADVFDIPIVKAPANESEDEKLSRIVEYLVRRGKQRPATLKTLLGSTAALFQPKLDEAEARALVSQLKANGIFEVAGSKLAYGLPD